MRRRTVLCATLGSATTFLAGCLDDDSAAIADWDGVDREADAWDAFADGYDVAKSIEDQDVATVETARDEFVSAREAYGALRDESIEADESAILAASEYFVAMFGACTSGRNALNSRLGEPVPGNISGTAHFHNIGGSLEEAATALEETEGLQDALDREPDDIRAVIAPSPADDEAVVESAEALVDSLDEEFVLVPAAEDPGWELQGEILYVDLEDGGNPRADREQIATSYASAVDDGMAVTLFVTMFEGQNITYSFEIEVDWARDYQRGALSRDEYLDRIEETVV